jgi:hypothetical protein
MTEENGHVEAGYQPDVVARTITVLSDSVQVLADQENRLAADLASVREKRVAAEPCALRVRPLKAERPAGSGPLPCGDRRGSAA